MFSQSDLLWYTRRTNNCAIMYSSKENDTYHTSRIIKGHVSNDSLKWILSTKLPLQVNKITPQSLFSSSYNRHKNSDLSYRFTILRLYRTHLLRNITTTTMCTRIWGVECCFCGEIVNQTVKSEKACKNVEQGKRCEQLRDRFVRLSGGPTVYCANH